MTAKDRRPFPKSGGRNHQPRRASYVPTRATITNGEKIMATTARTTGAKRERRERSGVGTKYADLIAENARLKRQFEAAQSTERTTMKGGWQFPPEVEAKRQDFEQLAHALRIIAELASARPVRTLDLDGFDEDSKHHLANGFSDHLYALWENMDWFNEITLRRFYAPMRLHVEDLNRQRASEHEAFEQESKSKEVALDA